LFFLKKDRLYPGDRFHMSDEVMERYIRQTIEAHRTPEVVIAWQGGEPTLMGLDFSGALSTSREIPEDGDSHPEHAAD